MDKVFLLAGAGGLSLDSRFSMGRANNGRVDHNLQDKTDCPELVTPHGKIFTILVVRKHFLADLSSSRSLVVGPSVRPSVGQLCEKVTFRVSNGNFNLPTYLPM